MNYDYLNFDSIPEIPAKRGAMAFISNRIRSSRTIQGTLLGIGLAAGAASGVMAIEDLPHQEVPVVIAGATIAAAFGDKLLLDKRNAQVMRVFTRSKHIESIADATSPRTIEISADAIKETRQHDRYASTEYHDGVERAVLFGAAPIEAFVSGRYGARAVIEKIAGNSDRFVPDTIIGAGGLALGAALMYFNESTLTHLETAHERQIDNIEGGLTLDTGPTI